jgi:hypothetical protein
VRCHCSLSRGGPSQPRSGRRARLLCLRLQRESRVRRWGLDGRGRGHTRWGSAGEGRLCRFSSGTRTCTVIDSIKRVLVEVRVASSSPLPGRSRLRLISLSLALIRTVARVRRPGRWPNPTSMPPARSSACSSDVQGENPASAFEGTVSRNGNKIRGGFGGTNNGDSVVFECELDPACQ